MKKTPNVKLFGKFQVSIDKELAFSTRKTACLFAYLAANTGAHVTRDRLKGIFWPDRAESQACASLRRALSDIRKVFEQAGSTNPLRTNSLHVSLDENAVSVDAMEFISLINSDPMSAGQLYCGELCTDLEAPGSTFDAWLQIERERYRRLAFDLVEEMASLAATSVELKATMALADRILMEDALSEEAHRAKILCLQRSGRQNAAVRTFEALSRTLAEEIGVEPEMQTRQLLLSPARPVFVSANNVGFAGERNEARQIDEFYEKPCLAVLPFENMSSNQELGYFSDGITEDIIAKLSRLRWLSVISKNSMFTYRARSLDIQKVEYELGARYVVGGSVRAQGTQMRITARLSETALAQSLWAQSFDRKVEDLFKVQDEITEAIAVRLNAEVAAVEQANSTRFDQSAQSDWQQYHQAMWHFHKFQKDSFAKAYAVLEKLLESSPNFARAHAALAFMQFTELSLRYDEKAQTKLERALEHAERAVSLDTNDDFCHFSLSRVLTAMGQSSRAMDAIFQALELNPNAAASLGALGYSYMWQGSGALAVEPLSKALRLSPRDPLTWGFLLFRSIAFSQQGQFDAAMADANSAVRTKPDEFWPYVALVWAAHETGDLKTSQKACEKASALDACLSLDEIGFITQTAGRAFVERMTDALKASGFQ